VDLGGPAGIAQRNHLTTPKGLCHNADIESTDQEQGTTKMAFIFITEQGAKCDYCGEQIAQGKSVVTTGRYDYCSHCADFLEIEV